MIQIKRKIPTSSRIRMLMHMQMMEESVTVMRLMQEGILEKTKKVIENMINKGFEEADICQITECSHEFFDKVRREMTK